MLRNFDILFFVGSDVVSKTLRQAMELVVGSDSASHVGLLFKGDMLPTHRNIDPQTWYVLETTASGRIGCYTASPIVDVVTGRGRLGTQIRPLQEVVNTYEGKVYQGMIDNNPTVRFPDEPDIEYNHRIRKLKNNLEQLLSTMINFNYNMSIWDCFYALCGCCRCCHCSSQTMICSQLVGIVLQHVKIIPNDVDPRTITPVDFLKVNGQSIDKDGMNGLVNEEELILLPIDSKDKV